MEQPPASPVVDAAAITGPISGAAGCPFDHEVTTEPGTEVPRRSAADRAMRRLLRLPVDAPPTSILGSEQVFGRSIAVSAPRFISVTTARVARQGTADRRRIDRCLDRARLSTRPEATGSVAIRCCHA